LPDIPSDDQSGFPLSTIAYKNKGFRSPLKASIPVLSSAFHVTLSTLEIEIQCSIVTMTGKPIKILSKAEQQLRRRERDEGLRPNRKHRQRETVAE
jgi:hypothetical protein